MNRVVLAGSLVPLFALMWSVKTVPAAIGVGVCGLAALAATSRYGRVFAGLVVAAAIVLAAVVVAVAACTWLVPPVTADGHGVMPIGQVVGGSALGIALGGWLAAKTRKREARANQLYLAALTVGTAVELIAHRFQQ